eukprot:1018232-Rhodomonas_salina.1
MSGTDIAYGVPYIAYGVPSPTSLRASYAMSGADIAYAGSEDGSVVLVEGREETVNFIPTEFRFAPVSNSPHVLPDDERHASHRQA